VQNETDPKVYQFKNSSCLVAILLLRYLVVPYYKCFFSILFHLRSCNAMSVVTLSLISFWPPRGSKDSDILWAHYCVFRWGKCSISKTLSAWQFIGLIFFFCLFLNFRIL
jgi:hypothetical protein